MCGVRNRLGVAVYREGERAERGETTLDEAAAILNVSPMTVLRMIRTGILKGRHLCKGAPWVIKAADIDRLEVREAANTRRKRPLTQNTDQETFIFQ